MTTFESSWPPLEGLAVGYAALRLFAVTVELSSDEFQESRAFITRAFSSKEARGIVRPLTEHWRLEKISRVGKNEILISNVLTEQLLDKTDEPGVLTVIDTDHTTFAEDDRYSE